MSDKSKAGAIAESVDQNVRCQGCGMWGVVSTVTVRGDVIVCPPTGWWTRPKDEMESFWCSTRCYAVWKQKHEHRLEQDLVEMELV